MPWCYVFLLSHMHRLSVCKKDFSLALEMTMCAKRYQNSAALLNFMRRTFTPHSSFLTRAELSFVIQGMTRPVG